MSPRAAWLLLLCAATAGLLRGQEASDEAQLCFYEEGAGPQKDWRDRLPCSCQDYTCGCCAGMTVQSYNFSHQACMNLTYDPYEFAVTSNMLMDDNSMFMNTFSGKNPPAACMPVPLPYLPMLIHMCVRIFNIFTPGTNLHLCVDFEGRVANKPVVILHFDCMRLGADGFALVKPEDNGGLDFSTPTSETDDEYDEVFEDKSGSNATSTDIHGRDLI
ncbi:uncharacterized protein [Periplaneta americana]|uniref:uncharacterized protein n=1 Tax=Periplaneta americana TaxID=6978 RepID=UPI0037E94A9B